LLGRIRHALLAYAATRFGFWKFSILVLVLVVAATGADLLHTAPHYFEIVFPVSVLLILVMPVMIWIKIPGLAQEYALESGWYSTAFENDRFFWQTPSALYEVPYSSIGRVFRSHDVVILGLRNSRAICVLPSEIIPNSQLSTIGENALGARARRIGP
jgi:hypothetical protein